MKLLIASDIHGSALYCGELLKAYDREKADRLLLLGDVLYHGPRNDLPDGYAPKEVIPMLNHLGHAAQSRACFGKHVVLDQNRKRALLYEPDGSESSELKTIYHKED